MADRILVPLDGSEVAKTVLPLVALFVQRGGFDVTLLRVLETGGGTAGLLGGEEKDTPPKEREAAQRDLDSVAQELAQRGLNVEAHIVRGDPATSIVDFAAAQDVDLIGMTTRSQRGILTQQLGSTASEIVRLATCPLLMLVAGKQPPSEIRTILVPLDDDDPKVSERILPFSHWLARMHQARVLLTTVLPRLTGKTIPAGPPLPKGDEELTQQYLDGIAETFRAAGIPVATRLKHGTPTDEIAQEAEATRADLVALATHAPSGLDRWLGGSVAEGLLAEGVGPLFVLPPRAADHRSS